MRLRRRLAGTAVLAAAGLLAAACSSSSSSTRQRREPGERIGFRRREQRRGRLRLRPGHHRRRPDLQQHRLLVRLHQLRDSSTPSRCTSSCSARCCRPPRASLQNQQIEQLVNEGAQAIIVNPETATSLGPAISYATAHHVQLVSVDTIVGVGKVYMVVRASNTLYGQDACAYISSKVKSGYVLDLEGDLTSSNGADRTDAFDSCMAGERPGREGAQGADRLDRRDRGHRRAERHQRLRLPAQGHLLAVVEPGHRHHPAAEEQGPRPRLGQPGHPDQRRRRAVRDVRHRQRLGRRVAVAARQPLRAVRPHLRGGRGQGRQARGRRPRRRRARAGRTSPTRATPTSPTRSWRRS